MYTESMLMSFFLNWAVKDFLLAINTTKATINDSGLLPTL